MSGQSIPSPPSIAEFDLLGEYGKDSWVLWYAKGDEQKYDTFLRELKLFHSRTQDTKLKLPKLRSKMLAANGKLEED
uniref:Uncharacterized protein n=1 Tax=Oryza glumipatula TaxID=40148 RepID=A0A0E0AGM3_9ORYZ